MARMLIDGEWYEELASDSLYENQFESVFVQQAPILYPDIYTVPFKCIVFSEHGDAKPDLALIDRQFRAWWVVEIELGHHPFESHVLQQVRRLATGVYGASHAEYIYNHEPDLDPERVLDLMKGRQPQVLVVVNRPMPRWKEPLSATGALLAVFQIFLSDRNKVAFRINGEHPEPPMDIISECSFEAHVPFLIVDAPAALEVPAQSKVKVWYNNAVTEWKRVDIQDKVYLIPFGRNVLPLVGRYQLLRQAHGDLVLRPK